MGRAALKGMNMEHGFYHPDQGYWQTTSEPSPDILASYPAGTTQVPTKPGGGYMWDGVAWVDPVISVADLKAAKNQAINLARAAANSSFFMFQGKRIAVDQLSRSDIDAAHGSILMLQALPPGWPGGWKSMDNEIVLIPDVATWAQFYGTMVATGTANFNHSQALKAQLAAASTPAEVEAVPEW